MHERDVGRRPPEGGDAQAGEQKGKGPETDRWRSRGLSHPCIRSGARPEPERQLAIPTIGWASFTAPVEPWNPAAPKENTPPSDATSQ